MKPQLPRHIITVCALLLSVYPLLFAQEPSRSVTLHFDPAHAQIHWTLGNVIHTVHGTFQLKGGVVSFDPATGAAEGELLVDLDSGASGNTTRDRNMKKNVLESQTYPEAIYHPEKVSGTLRSGPVQSLTIDGTFTIHGKDHPLRLIVSSQMTSASGVHLTTHFVVPYVQWGMKDPSTLVLRVNKQVSIDVSADASVEGLH